MELNKIFFRAPHHSKEELRENEDGVIMIPRKIKEEKRSKIESINQFSIQFGCKQKKLWQHQDQRQQNQIKGDLECPDIGEMTDRYLYLPMSIKQTRQGSNQNKANLETEEIFPVSEKRDELPELISESSSMIVKKQDISGYLSPCFSQINSFATTTLPTTAKSSYNSFFFCSNVPFNFEKLMAPASTLNEKIEQERLLKQQKIKKELKIFTEDNFQLVEEQDKEKEEEREFLESKIRSMKNACRKNQNVEQNCFRTNKITKLEQENDTQNFDIEKYSSQTHIAARLAKSPEEYCSHVLLYFHSNAEDIITSLQLIQHIRRSLSIHVISVEYPGYSFYKGESNAKQIEEDSLQVFDYLVKEAEVIPAKIIVLGRSMGTGAATYLASKRKVGSLALISPFTSLQNLLTDKAGFLGYLFANRFDNLERISRVTCPTFILHGQKDSLIPISHAQLLHQKCGGVCELVLPKSMTHNSFDFYQDFTQPFTAFLWKNNIKYNSLNSKKKILFPPCMATQRKSSITPPKLQECKKSALKK